TAPQTESEPALQTAPVETAANPSAEQRQIEAAAAKIQAAVQDVLKD
ncbi:TPA: phosphatidylserine decarboxylase family protein, partial [Neisseria meningitidis]